MKIYTPDLASHLLNDPEFYLLKSGRIFRKFSLDELPNLVNIIMGDLSFVGPRPALYNQYDLISYRNKLGIQNIKPGITGLAQVNGRDKISIQRKVQLDFYYLNNRSLILNLKIIIRTFFKFFYNNDIIH